MTERLCACGCGETLKGRLSQRFVSDAHRKRSRRAESAATEQIKIEAAAGAVPAVRGAPSNGSIGRTRAGLEVWLARQDVELAEMLVEAARSLADEVDREPEASPLWGRYLDAVRQLHEPEVQAKAWSAAVRELYEELATIEAAEAWRVQRYQRAVDNGEEHPDRWTKLVPFGCLLDRHHWHQWGGPESPKTCLDCRGRLEDDDVVRWPSYLVGSLWEDEPV
jgi:hypothetical protein